MLRQKVSLDQEARSHRKHLILERDMKPQSEIEKIATRRIAKAIIEQADLEGWRKLKDESEVAAKVSQAVARHSSQHGIHPLFIKSAIMRLQDGRI